MIPSMAKHKQPAPPPKPRTPVLNLRLGHDLESRLAKWMAKQRVEPDKTAVVLTALDEFLEREGFPSESEPK